MSWNDLVNNNLIGTKAVSKAAICGVDGTVWGKSDNFQLGTEEIQSVIAGLRAPENLPSTGLKFEGEKYFVLQADNERIIGKKASKGFFVYKSSQAFIISLYADGIQPEQCSKATGALADYFKNTGY